MEKVNSYSCVSKPLCNYNVQYSTNAAKLNSSPRFLSNNIGITSDQFIQTDKKILYQEQLNKLFPNGGFDVLCKEINKDFNIDNPANVKLVSQYDGVTGGGYQFYKNEITLNYEDILGSDTKIVGIKNGKRTVLTSPSVKLPLFVDKKSAEEFLKLHSQNGNLGFDQLVAEPVTENEQRKFISQKLAHEIIHSQQHMILRQTEGIGEKEVLKAWSHYKPQNLIDNYILNHFIEKQYSNSYWANQEPTEQKIPKESKTAQIAHVWLEAIRNYPPVESPEYLRNPIEMDAYIRSAQYADKKFGAW